MWHIDGVGVVVGAGVVVGGRVVVALGVVVGGFVSKKMRLLL